MLVLDFHNKSQCMYLHVSVCIYQYMYVYAYIYMYHTLEYSSDHSFIASTPANRVVCGPNHGPRVDVEQLAPRSRGPSLITRAQGIARVSTTGHVAGNRSEIPCWGPRAVSATSRSASSWSMKKPVIKRWVLHQVPSAHCKILLPALSTFHSSRRALRHWCIRAMRWSAVPCGPCSGRPA